MTQYLGRIFDANTHHFEHDVCPACSAGRDKGGRLTRSRLPSSEIEKWSYHKILVYDKKQDIVGYVEAYRGEFSSDEEYLNLCHKICLFLRCSRWPDCQFYDTHKAIFVDDPSSLFPAKRAYLNPNTSQATRPAVAIDKQGQESPEFDALISELEFLLAKVAPQMKVALDIAAGQDLQEFTKREKELGILRNRYSEIVRKLNKLDAVKARKEIIDTITKVKGG